MPVLYIWGVLPRLSNTVRITFSFFGWSAWTQFLFFIDYSFSSLRVRIYLESSRRQDFIILPVSDRKVYWGSFIIFFSRSIYWAFSSSSYGIESIIVDVIGKLELVAPWSSFWFNTSVYYNSCPYSWFYSFLTSLDSSYCFKSVFINKSPETSLARAGLYAGVFYISESSFGEVI